MHACIHPSMHACIHTYIHPCMHAYIHACIHTYIHACMHAYIHACMHTYIHTSMHACMHTCMHAYIHTYINTYIHACMHTYMHACIHTYIHTLNSPLNMINEGFSQCYFPDPDPCPASPSLQLIADHMALLQQFHRAGRPAWSRRVRSRQRGMRFRYGFQLPGAWRGHSWLRLQSTYYIEYHTYLGKL